MDPTGFSLPAAMIPSAPFLTGTALLRIVEDLQVELMEFGFSTFYYAHYDTQFRLRPKNLLAQPRVFETAYLCPDKRRLSHACVL